MTDHAAPSLFDEGPPPPCPAVFDIPSHALAPAPERPDAKVALTVAGAPGAPPTRWTYGEMRDAVARAAGGLSAAGLAPGDRAVLRIGGDARFPILFLGAMAAGIVPVPTSPQLTEGELHKAAALIGADALLCDDALAIAPPAGARLLDGAALERALRADPAPFRPARADDLAYIVFTSGSSGAPKAVGHAHRAAFARRMMWRDWYGLDRRDVMLHAGAFNWTFTLGTGLLDPWGAGASTVIYTGPPDPAIWPRLAAEHGATLFAGAPGVLRQCLKYAENPGAGFAGLRAALSAGEALPESVRAGWEAATGKPVYEALGMSEVSTYISGSAAHAPRPGFAGRPQRGRRVAILADESETPVPRGVEGRLAISTADQGLMLGYIPAPGAAPEPLEGDWFVTGDRAVMDADGHVGHRGRADGLMNAGGFRVAAEEVESALAAHPAIRDCAAVALPVADGVSVIAAFWEGEAADEADLSAHCAARLAAYKRPRRFTRLDHLPRTATGKLRRGELIRAHGFKSRPETP